ncbi:hypothetical protein [Christensenella minuta]|uniref:hypothetical protein n=1 Tax=Christensenella minuta TaxID=626937 RepID=UPI0021572556|nr:hypothetical protein [Christensenella minuta]
MVSDNAEKILDHLNSTSYDNSVASLASSLNLPSAEITRALLELNKAELLYCVVSDNKGILKVSPTNKGLTYSPIRDKTKRINRQKRLHKFSDGVIIGFVSGTLSTLFITWLTGNLRF